MRRRPPSPRRRSDEVIVDRLDLKVIPRSRGSVLGALLRALLAASALAAIAITGAACRHEGVPFDCECDMLTDYDDGWKLPVRACAADAREAPDVARGCAQLGAPAPIQSCKCAPAIASATPCRHGCLD